MSTHWGLRCKECFTLATWFQSSPEKVQMCLEAWPHVKAIRELDKMGDVTIEILGDDGSSEIWLYLMAHDGHTLEICNEYNETYDHWKLRKDNPLSEETRSLISYWLRGAIKGYGVRLDQLGDDSGYTLQNLETIARELYILSDGSVDLDILLSWQGMGIRQRG